MNAMLSTNREAIDETNIPIKVKNKFVNFLFTNSELEEVTFYKTTICFFSLFIITLALSIFLYVEIGTVKEISKQYYTPGGSCTINSTCTVTIQVDEAMTAPIYFMYYLGMMFGT